MKTGEVEGKEEEREEESGEKYNSSTSLIAEEVLRLRDKMILLMSLLLAGCGPAGESGFCIVMLLSERENGQRFCN